MSKPTQVYNDTPVILIIRTIRVFLGFRHFTLSQKTKRPFRWERPYGREYNFRVHIYMRGHIYQTQCSSGLNFFAIYGSPGSTIGTIAVGVDYQELSSCSPPWLPPVPPVLIFPSTGNPFMAIIILRNQPGFLSW